MYVINLQVTCSKLVVFSTNKTDRRDIAEILLEVAPGGASKIF
jgi:hypothetical protein